MPTLDAPLDRSIRPATPDPWWRVALVAGGVVLLLGGPMHPDAPADLDLREELATMMDDDAWVPAHSLLLLGTVLLALGLWRAWRTDAWSPRARGALRFAVVAVALYAVEALVHLAAAVDVDRLRDGGFAPVAFTHIGLAMVLYPLSGVALAVLAWRLLPTWSLAQRPFAIAGIVGGAAHAVSAPATVIFADAEVSPVFAVAGVTIAVWAIAAGLVGIRAASAADRPAESLVA